MRPYAGLGLMDEYALHIYADDGYAPREYSPFIPHVHTAGGFASDFDKHSRVVKASYFKVLSPKAKP